MLRFVFIKGGRNLPLRIVTKNKGIELEKLDFIHQKVGENTFCSVHWCSFRAFCNYIAMYSNLFEGQSLLGTEESNCWDFAHNTVFRA